MSVVGAGEECGRVGMQEGAGVAHASVEVLEEGVLDHPEEWDALVD